jgi:hypothetical protein
LDFLEDDFRLDLFDEDFLPLDFLAPDFLLGTLPPALRASDKPIAIACFLLVTFLPDPLFNVPRLRSRIVFSTFSDAFFPYLAIHVLLEVIKHR